MCGGGGGGDGGAAEREKARQAKISSGLNNINRIFDGYQQGVNPITGGPELDASYFLNDGTAVTYGNRQVTNPEYTAYQGMTPNERQRNGYVGFYGPAPKQTPTEFLSQNFLSGENGKDLGAYTGARALFGGSEHIGGFQDSFFNDREQSYLDFALPQLEDQFVDQKDNLLFSLARNGRLNSQTRGESLGDLQKQYDLQRTNINDRALGVANTARSDIERARSDLVQQNNSLANPAAIAGLASQRAEALSQAPQFDPLGTLFQNSTASLATAQSADNKRSELNKLSNLFLPNTSGGASRIVGG